jgi:hypothetical protein
VLDRIEPAVDVILERIENTTDYKVPDLGRAADLGSEVSG